MSAEENSQTSFLRNLCLTDEYSDVTLLVNNEEKIPAHRFILVSQSQYFALVPPTASKTYNMVTGPQANVDALKQLLRLAYGDKQLLVELSSDSIFGILHLAYDYEFNEILELIFSILEKHFTIENVVSNLNMSIKKKHTDLIEKCYNYLDANADEFIINKIFWKLSESSFIGLLERDTFATDEMKIFTAATEWYEQNPTANKNTIINLIRFPLMDTTDLVNLSSIMPLAPEPNQIVDAIKMKTSCQLNPRKSVLKKQIIKPSKKELLELYGAKVVLGRSSKELRSDNVWCECIQSDKNNTIIIEFDTARQINNIEFQLLVVERSYSVEISLDQNEWKKVVDFTGYICRNRQSVYFHTENITFVKIISNDSLRVKDFFSQRSNFIPPLANEIGVINPIKNICTDAIISDRWLSKRMINYEYVGNTTNLTIHFNQPYLICSLSLNCNDCKFRIESGGNSLINHTDQFLSGFCNFEFEPTIVTYLKLYVESSHEIKITDFSIPAKYQTEPLSKRMRI